MTTREEAVDSFASLVSAEASRELEKTGIAAANTQSQFIKANSAGSRMYVYIAKNHVDGLVALRQFIAISAAAHLKPYAEHGSSEDLAFLVNAVVATFDVASARFEFSLRKYLGRPGDLNPAMRALTQVADPLDDVLRSFAQSRTRERDSLRAELALSMSRPQLASAAMDRRLTAVLVTDIVESSKLMAADEAATVAAFAALERQCAEIAARHGGRLVKGTGDGTLSEFKSAHGALEAALDILRTVAQQDAAKPQDRRIELRVGLTVGDVHTNGDDILGNAVNLATRLQEIAAPGTICLPALLHDELGLASGVVFTDLGPQALKNMSRKVRVFQATPQM